MAGDKYLIVGITATSRVWKSTVKVCQYLIMWHITFPPDNGVDLGLLAKVCCMGSVSKDLAPPVAPLTHQQEMDKIMAFTHEPLAHKL